MEVIRQCRAYMVLDSRGLPTVACTLTLSSGQEAAAQVPSGASTGSREALELRDNNSDEFGGKGVSRAIAQINNTIARKIIGLDPCDQRRLDDLLIAIDGTANKSNLGANAMLAVSTAALKAAALVRDQPLAQYIADLTDTTQPTLPVPLFNVLNGGVHADNSINVQEFMLLPTGATSFSAAMQMGAEIYHALKANLKQQGLSTNVGDEGGFAPNLNTPEEALDALMAAIESAGYKAGVDCSLALDVAASEFYVDGVYHLTPTEKLSRSALIERYQSWQQNYPLVSIEDGMAEDDDKGWQALQAALGSKIQLVGDDVFVTNPALIEDGIKNKMANAVLIKLNQIGTVSETLAAIKMTQDAGWNAVISHRSGETSDTTIADLAVGTGAGQIKAGAPARGERVAKYNRLLELEQRFSLPYAGWPHG